MKLILNAKLVNLFCIGLSNFLIPEMQNWFIVIIKNGKIVGLEPHILKILIIIIN